MARRKPGGSPEAVSVGEFLDRCTSCGACANECTLLKTSGTPDTIISQGDRDVFLCTNCGACTVACPSGLDPADALLQTKHYLHTSGQITERESKTVRAARRFAWWGRSFPFRYYSRAETVFWPGCALAGMSPALVLKTQRLLSGQLGEKVGIALDCCSDAAYQLGDFETARAAATEIERAFERKGITRIITACTNCLKIFRRYLPNVKVDHVVEILPKASGRSLTGKTFYLHHPCPTYRFAFLQKQARSYLEGHRVVVQEQTRPRCCGSGGNLPSLSQEQVAVCTRETTDAAGEVPIITYCMGCRERFLRQGKEAYHMLQLFVDARVSDRPLTSFRKWYNRFLLKLRMRLRETGTR